MRVAIDAKKLPLPGGLFACFLFVTDLSQSAWFSCACFTDSDRRCCCCFAFRCKFLALSFQYLIKVFCPVNPLARPKNSGADIVAEYLLGGLPVLLVHREEKQREHQPHHQKRRRAVTDALPREDVNGDSDNRSRAKANKLAFGEVKSYLCLDAAEAFGYADIGHCKTCNRQKSGFLSLLYREKYAILKLDGGAINCESSLP